MTGGPLISIVLPTFNGARYLRGAVESVRRQTWTRWELILVDDCSSDATPGLIAELAAAEPRIRAFRNPVNLRLPRSLNAGFERARGEFLTWTSDDNEYRPGALEALHRVLESDPGAGVAYSDAFEIDDDGQPLGPWRAPEPEALAWCNSVNACFLYRRAVAEQVGGYDDHWVLVEDWDFWMRVSLKFRLRVLHEDLYLYRRHARSLTTTRAGEIRRARLALMEQRVPEMHWLDRRSRAEAWLKMARQAHELQEPDRERKFNRRALAASPLFALAKITGRAVLGHDRAGALLHRWRRRR